MRSPTERRRAHILRSPVVLFLLVGAAMLGAIVAVTGHYAGKTAADEAIIEARATNRVLARSVAAPYIKSSNIQDNPGAIDTFDRIAQKLLLVGDVKLINIWSEDGRLIYSNDFLLIGQSFPLTADQRAVLARGGTGSEVADPDSPRNQVTDVDVEGLVQIYTDLTVRRGDDPLLFEAYWSLDQIDARRTQILSSFRWITIGPLVLMMVVVTIMLQLLTRQVRNAGRERERLLRSVIDASDAERRRIARDLHDGVVQDLAGTTFSLTALARDPGTTAPTRTILESSADSLRTGLKALRSLLAEIHPADLQAQGLPAALADLTAPAATAGIQSSVSVEGIEACTDAQIALVWRVAQEAVRNSIRHSQASTLAITVRGDVRELVLEVVDDGIGFDPDGIRAPDRFGLRGLRSLVSEVGGDLEVVSAVGEGTTVRMAVKLP